MKKLAVLLSTILVLMTGCGITKLSDTNTLKNIKTIMSEETNLHNVNYDGYDDKYERANNEYSRTNEDNANPAKWKD